MSWHGIEGHDEIVAQFRQRLAAGRLASTFLFVGPEGIGKRTLALKLAQALLCQTNDPRQLNPCGKCASCVQMQSQTHPDLLQVAKPADKSEIPVALFIGEKDRRMKEGLCHDIWMKPVLGARRVAIIDDADRLNEEGANCLLKTLEEPPPAAVVFLIGTSLERQLPTIRSRAQIVRFNPLDRKTVAALLVSRGLVTDAAEADRLAAHAEGSLSRALELSDPALWKFRADFLLRLSKPDWDPFALAKQLQAFVDDVEKEMPSSAKRARVKIAITFVVDFYRRIARELLGLSGDDDPEIADLVRSACTTWRGDLETAAACVDRSLEALEHLDRYANQATLIEGWLDDLAVLLTPRRAATAQKA